MAIDKTKERMLSAEQMKRIESLNITRCMILVIYQAMKNNAPDDKIRAYVYRALSATFGEGSLQAALETLAGEIGLGNK
jgi:hypothetical protein